MAPKKNLMENYDDGNLDLSLSGLQDVPVRDIATFPKKVSFLDLSCNIIVTLPKTFAPSLIQLVKLDLSQNQLTSLPENFGLLVNLIELDLDNNKLESLPLSFGNLKSLRWLDLKRNPLMPKLAQIAGMCLDAQQCHAAAKNVVAALRATQEQVNAEIARRKEEQKKTVEEETLIQDNMKNQNKENHQSKKKKKKGANSASSGNPVTNQTNGQSHIMNDGLGKAVKNEQIKTPPVPTKKQDQNVGFLRKVGRLLSTIVKVVVMCILIGVLCGFLLNLIDEEMYMTLRKRVISFIHTNVPKHYLKQWDNGLSVTRRTIRSWSGQLIAVSIHYFHKLQDTAVAFTNDETVQQYLESIKSGWHILWIWICETYANLCTQIPYYFNIVKSVFFESSSNVS